MRWADLSVPWRACLEEAWAAYCAGSIPIGAVVVNATGEIQTRGRNHINDTDAPAFQVSANQLAHAELNALLAMRAKPKDVHSYALYTAVEPCPLCLGAFYMSGVRQIHYACRDDYAGAIDLLGKTWYLAHKPITAFGPETGALENVVFALQMDYHLQERSPQDHVIARQRINIEPGACLGEQLAREGTLRAWREQGLSAAVVFNHLFTLLDA